MKRGTVSSWKFEDSLKQSLGIRHPQKGQILVQGMQINLRSDSFNFQQRLYLGRKRQPSIAMAVVKRLDPKMIACHE